MSKYKWTIFDTSKVIFQVPVKKSESRNYFFRVPIKWIWYIPLDTFFILLWFYVVLGLFWFNLYQQHLLLVSWITMLNVIISTVVLFRHQVSWKNMFDMIRIIYRYMRKKQLFLLKPKKNDLVSKYQIDELSLEKEWEIN